MWMAGLMHQMPAKYVNMRILNSILTPLPDHDFAYVIKPTTNCLSSFSNSSHLIKILTALILHDELMIMIVLLTFCKASVQ